MKDDPWDWTKQSTQAPPPLQTNNTLVVPPSGQTQAPPPVQGPPGFGQVAGNILVARGVNKGIDSGFKAGEEYFKPHDPSKVPVEDAKIAIDNTIQPMSSSRSMEAPLSDASTTNANTPTLGETATASAGGSSVANNVLPLANQAVSTEGVDMAFQAADQAQLMNQGLSATQAASTVAPLSETAAVAGTRGLSAVAPLSEAAALDAAATTGANAAAASSVAAGAGAGAAVGTGAAGAGAAAAAAPLAMTPIGWGIGALLLAKQMKWI